MKNLIRKILLLLIIFSTSSLNAFAIQEGKVISDSATQKSLINAFDDVNKYTDSFFTPHVKKTVKDDELILGPSLERKDPQTRGSVMPVKRFRLMVKNRHKPKTTGALAEETVVKDQAILDCDLMEFFAERTELEANGHVVMFFPENKSTIKADKVIYNQTSNLIKAFGNVILITEGKELFGDYMQIDMNEENAFLDNPATDLFQIRARAKKGYMYGDKIIQEQGSMYVTKKTMINIKSDMFGPDLSTMFIEDKDKSYLMKDSHGEKFKIKTNDLIINSKKEHDDITLKHAEIYCNDKKIGTIPSITMHTNKNQDYLEADFPEIGTMSNLGMYAGPGFVFDTPGGTTLKLIPMLNYDGGGGDSSDATIGFGGIAKFKSASNKTDMYWGSVNSDFIMRGIQKLDDNLIFQYASNAYMDDWFMGFRMAKSVGELVYQDSFLNKNFFGKDKDMTYTNRLSAAYAQDYDMGGGYTSAMGQGGIGTMRFKYMTEAAQTLYKYGKEYDSLFNGKIELLGQGSAAVYGTGDTQMVARIGPRIHTQYKYWMQDVGYFLSAYSDQSPLVMYDRYMYGRSNVYLRESLRLHKYLTLSWFGSVNLSNDAWDGKMLQENGFYFAIGPDDVKLNIGYDTVRQQSFITMAMNLDAKGSTLEYKKMVIKNPERLGKNENLKKQPFQAFSPVSDSNNNDDDDAEDQKAEVTDIIQEAL